MCGGCHAGDSGQAMKHQKKTNPPGRRKIIKALDELMKRNNFHAITTAEIAATAGVTEGLIYKYFKDKKDLLYEVLNVHFQAFQADIEQQVTGKPSCLAKLETVISATLTSYAANRVFAKILLLEVRSSPSYFDSEAYAIVRLYARTILDIIHDGIRLGEIRNDVDPALLQKTLIGAIEHACLGEVIFTRELDVTKTTAALSNILFNGVKPHES